LLLYNLIGFGGSIDISAVKGLSSFSLLECRFGGRLQGGCEERELCFRRSRFVGAGLRGRLYWAKVIRNTHNKLATCNTYDRRSRNPGRAAHAGAREQRRK
jgi:hypothetical protein